MQTLLIALVAKEILCAGEITGVGAVAATSGNTQVLDPDAEGCYPALAAAACVFARPRACLGVCLVHCQGCRSLSGVTQTYRIHVVIVPQHHGGHVCVAVRSAQPSSYHCWPCPCTHAL